MGESRPASGPTDGVCADGVRGCVCNHIIVSTSCVDRSGAEPEVELSRVSRPQGARRRGPGRDINDGAIRPVPPRGSRILGGVCASHRGCSFRTNFFFNGHVLTGRWTNFRYFERSSVNPRSPARSQRQGLPRGCCIRHCVFGSIRERGPRGVERYRISTGTFRYGTRLAQRTGTRHPAEQASVNPIS